LSAETDRIASAEWPASVIVYGAGGFGRRLAAALSAAGTSVEFFVDAQLPESTVDGIEVRSFQNWQPTQVDVVLGISNPTVNLKILEADLLRMGVMRVLGPVRASAFLHTRGIDLSNYWMTGDQSLYSERVPEIQAARALLQDDESRATFDAVLTYRTNGQPRLDPQGLGLSEQYFPPDIDFVTSRMRYVDVGAFDGDTVRQLRDRGCDVEAIIALEPDPRNFANLSSLLSTVPCWQPLALPLGLGGACETLAFDASGNSAAVVSEAGSTTIQCVDLDSLAGKWRPTHVKLDIEGAEASALMGMRNTIRESRPRIAVAAYHRPEDHWSLLLLLSQFAEGYRYFMRTYGQQTFDTVVYAIPNEN
jgi:FkbM family methyltransferase